MAVNRRETATEPLNLIPIMNLVTILIPFLLLSAQFIHLAVIDSTLPAIAPPQAQEEMEEPDKPPLVLSLGITQKGIHVLGADHVLFPDGVPELGEGEEKPPTVPCLSAGKCTGTLDYNWAELTRMLAQIKDEYPDDQNVILVPDSNVPYEILVHTMDAARADQENPNPDTGEAKLLFPFVVIAGGAI